MNKYFVSRNLCPCCHSPTNIERCRKPYTGNPLREHLVSFYSPLCGVEFKEPEDHLLVREQIFSLDVSSPKNDHTYCLGMDTIEQVGCMRQFTAEPDLVSIRMYILYIEKDNSAK